MHRNDDTTTRFSPTGPGPVRQSHRLAEVSGAPTFAHRSASPSRVLSSVGYCPDSPAPAPPAASEAIPGAPGWDPVRLAESEDRTQLGLTNEAAGSGRHRRRRRPAARATAMIIVLTVLSVLGIGYVRFAAHEQAAPPRPADPVVPPGESPFTAEAAIALAQLQRQVADAYTHTRLWQAASALSATIGFMRATGSQAYLRDLSATYLAHHAPPSAIVLYVDL